jgi:hypothetical protein
VLIAAHTDSRSSLSFGRPVMIDFPHNVPIPQVGNPTDPSLELFTALCELVMILDKLRAVHVGQDPLDALSGAASELERWKSNADFRGLFALVDENGKAFPGVKSLHLQYLGGTLIVVREIWNNAGATSLGQHQCQVTSLMACEAMVDFVCELEEHDLRGYWSSSES